MKRICKLCRGDVRLIVSGVWYCLKHGEILTGQTIEIQESAAELIARAKRIADEKAREDSVK